MTEEDRKLLPCPHCGAMPTEQAIEAHTHSAPIKGLGIPDHDGSHFIECACGAGMIDGTREAVLLRWNRRTRPESDAALLRQAAEALEFVDKNIALIGNVCNDRHFGDKLLDRAMEAQVECIDKTRAALASLRAALEKKP